MFATAAFKAVTLIPAAVSCVTKQPTVLFTLQSVALRHATGERATRQPTNWVNCPTKDVKVAVRLVLKIPVMTLVFCNRTVIWRVKSPAINEMREPRRSNTIFRRQFNRQQSADGITVVLGGIDLAN